MPKEFVVFSDGVVFCYGNDDGEHGFGLLVIGLLS
jgi:hypothetical protein